MFFPKYTLTNTAYLPTKLHIRNNNTTQSLPKASREHPEFAKKSFCVSVILFQNMSVVAVKGNSNS